MRTLAIIGSWLLVICCGCSATDEKEEADVVQEMTLKCSGGWAECYRQANRVCRDGFDELDRLEPASAARTAMESPRDLDSIENETFARNVDERSLTIRCH